MRRLDLAVFPYDLRRFGVMTSGVFADAVSAGAATVVPSGSWMAGIVESGRAAGVTFDQFSVDGIAGAVARAVDDLERLQANAASTREAWRVEQGLATYVDRLLLELTARGLIQLRR